MDATNEVVTMSASNASATATIQTPTNVFNVNQSNNNVHTHTHTHNGSNSLINKTTGNVISSSSICIGGSSNNGSSSNSSCSSSSTSSNSSGYGSTTTTPTNNYDLQQTTPTTTPVPTTPVSIPEHIIPVATVAAVTPFYNETLTTHNLETHHVQHQRQHPQQQQLQPQPHHMLQTNHHEFSQNHLPANQQQHHQYLPRQQYYSPYDYQQTATTHNLVDSPGTLAVAPYNVIIPGSYDVSSSAGVPSYGAGQYKSLSSSDATNYERNPAAKADVTSAIYNHQQQQQLQGEQQHSKSLNHQTQHQTGVLAATKQRSSTSLINNSSSINTSKPQAAATPFYANPTPIYDNYKRKIPFEYHDTYNNHSTTTAATYHQQQKYYAAAKSQLKEAAYGSPTAVNNKSLYPNAGNYFPGSTGSRNLPTSYEKFMYSHTSATDYSTSGHLSNETPPEVSNYRKPVVENAMNSPSWPWGIDYASGNSRSIPPPASHLPTATVAPTHATHFPQNPSVIARDPYYMGHDKYSVRYEKYTAPSYQQSYGSPPANRHLWPSIPHASNLTQLNERHILATGSSGLPSHGLHTTSYFPNNSTTALNSRQSCCSQPYQPQSCYYPPLHPVPTRLHHSQTPTVVPPTGGYLPSQQALGQSTHLNALSASCKYGGALPDCGNGNKIKNSNDLYLNVHHYDNNIAPNNFAYGSGHNSQQLYAAHSHQSMVHGNTPASLLTNDPLNANPTSYTNDLSLSTSNFDNYHTHLNTHPSQQSLPGFPNQQPPPAYAPTVAKRALLDYRKPIQLQNPTAISEDYFASLYSRDHYNQQELLNTPETTTNYGEYETHQGKLSTLSTLSQTSEVINDADRGRDESNKNLSLRDFIANWNDDEDEYQNNEDINFDQNNVIEEVLQAAPVEREAAALELDDATTTKPSLLECKTNDESLKESGNSIESLVTTLNDPEANQYNNLPDIVIDIEKSNIVSNSVIATTSITSPKQDEACNTSLSLTNFDVEKELDELNLKKPVQQEQTKDSNDIKDKKNMTTPQLSPCRNITNQLSFEDLQLESGNNTVLNPIATRVTNTHTTDLNEQYFKDIEGYESSSSRHSNESAFEKEYETFINKITSETSTNKGEDEKATDAEKEINFVQNVHDFSKFYKRKRKLKEDEPKTLVPANQCEKRLKTTAATKVNNSNFPQVYTKKSRNRANKAKLQSLHKRKPISPYYKIIHSIRRFGLYREKRVREYMAELKEKHLPLIKRQSIKNYTHVISESLFNVQSLKALCLIAINTDEFRQLLLLTMVGEEDKLLETEEKHICIDPTCETCEVIKSLMEAESFEATLIQQATENNDEINQFPATMFCVEGNNEPTTILKNTPNTIDLNIRNEEHIMISRETENAQYSKENFPAFDTKDLERDHFNSTVEKSFLNETNMVIANGRERSKSPKFILQAKDCFESSSQPASETAKMTNSETGLAKIDNITPEQVVNPFTNNEPTELVTEKYLPDDNSSNLNVISKNIREMFAFKISIKNKDPLESSASEQVQESESESETESENSDSSESDIDSSSSNSEDKSVEDSRDSCKRSNSSNENNDTDIENDLDDEDEIVHSDLNLSCQVTNNSPHKNSKNQAQKFNSITKEDTNFNDTKKEQKDFIHTGVHSQSDNEDEIIPKCPQRIVIRITKSLSPNNQSLRVENIFGKSLRSHAEVNNETDSESKDDDIAKAKSEIITDSKNLSLKQRDDLQETIPEKSKETQTDNNLEDKFKKEIKSDMVLAPFKLSLRRMDAIEDQAIERPLDADIDSDDNSQSEYGDTELDEASPNLSPKQKAEICADEKSVKRKTSSEYEAADILEKNSPLTTSSLEEPHDEYKSSKEHDAEMRAIALKSSEKEETVQLQTFEKIKESHLEFYESENGSEKQSQVISKSLNVIMKTEVILNKVLGPNSENNMGDLILEKKSEISTSSSSSSANQEDCPFQKVEGIKSIENSLGLNSMQESSKENQICLQSSESLIPTESEKIPKYSIVDNVFVNDLEKNLTSIHKPTQISPKLQAIDNEHGLENTIIFVNESENIEKEAQKDHQDENVSVSNFSKEINNEKSDSISSPFFEMNQNGGDIKRSTEANVKTYDLLDSESEDDEEAEQSDEEFYSKDEIQDSSSSYDSESENDNNEILEPIKSLNNPKTIIISDDESINSCDTNEDALQPYENIEESEETKESLGNKIHHEFVEKEPENLNNSLDLDFELIERNKHEKERTAIIRRWSFEDDEFSKAEINDTKQLFAKSPKRQDCDENNFNKYSLEDCDSTEASDDKEESANTSNHKLQKEENDDKHEIHSNTLEMNEGIPEPIILKVNQASDCETKSNEDLVQYISPAHSLKQSNDLQKPITLHTDSKTFNEKAEILQIFSNDRSELEDIIENSNSLPEVTKVNSMTEYSNIIYNSPNHIREGDISDSESHTSDETNSIEEQFDEIPRKETYSPITEQNHNISQVIIERYIANQEAIDDEPPVILENEVFESEETFAQLMPADSELPLEGKSLVHSKEIGEAANSLETSAKKMCDTLTDFDCKNNFTLKDSEIIPTAEIMETAISEVTKDVERTINDLETKNVENFSTTLAEDSNMSKDNNDQSQNKNCNKIDDQSSDINSVVITQKSDYIDKVDDKEPFEEISNQYEGDPENKSIEFERIVNDSKEVVCCNRLTNILNESIENISKTELEEIEIITQKRSVKSEILEDQILENSESSVDHKTTTCELITKELISKPKSDEIEELKSKDVESEKTELNNQILEESPTTTEEFAKNIILEDNKVESLDNITDEEELEPKIELKEIEIITQTRSVNSEILEDQILENSDSSEISVDHKTTTCELITKEVILKPKSDEIEELRSKDFESERTVTTLKSEAEKLKPVKELNNPILEESATTTDELAKNIILEDDKVKSLDNTIDEEELEPNIELEEIEFITQTRSVNSELLEGQILENSESSVDHKTTTCELITKEFISKPKSDEIEELRSKDFESESTVTTLKSEAEKLKPVKELNNPILEDSATTTKELAENIILEDKKVESLDNIIDEEELEPETKNFSTLDESESILEDITNQHSDEVVKVSRDIESITTLSQSEDLGNSCKNSNISEEESVEPFESANEEFGVEIDNEFNSEDSKYVEKVKECEKEEAVVDLAVQPQTEFEIPSNTTEPFEERLKENEELGQQTITHDNTITSAKTEEATGSQTKHQTENPQSSLNETLGENVFEKDCSTTEEMFEDFFGFKNQSSFEEESEDFHGFEDLEEVTRIRQEIENLKDDSTANDGFLNNLILNRQMSKSPTNSSNESMSSEINELEALEREISQHQLEMRVQEDDPKDHSETENELPTKTIEVVSSNDIEHIKQMLESDEEQPTYGEDQKTKEKLVHKHKDKSIEINKKNIPKDIITSVKSKIPKLSDLCRAALNSSLNSTSNFAQQHTETSAILAERELSVEEALAEMYRQAGVLLSDPEDCDNDIPSPSNNEARDVLLINLQEILNSDNNEVYVLQCDMNENVLNVVQSTTEELKVEKHQANDSVNTERVDTVQIILDTENPEPQIHIISSDSESEVIILSDDESDFSYRPFTARQDRRITIPFINDHNFNYDDDSSFDISTIHHEEIVPDNLNKFLQEEFYKYLHEKYVQRNISKYYHANRVLKKYKKRFLRAKWQ